MKNPGQTLGDCRGRGDLRYGGDASSIRAVQLLIGAILHYPPLSSQHLNSPTERPQFGQHSIHPVGFTRDAGWREEGKRVSQVPRLHCDGWLRQGSSGLSVI